MTPTNLIPGFGKDTINNDDASNGNDIAKFKDVSYQDLWFSKSGTDLQITVAGTDNQVTVKDWYNGNRYQLDAIHSQASTLLNNKVDQLVQAMASYNVPLGAGNVIPQAAKDALKVTLASAWS